MKKFLGKIAIFLVFIMVMTIPASVSMDPYNIFHWNDIRNNGVEPNKNYIKMKYLLDNPGEYDSLFFGSSRVGAIHTENFQGISCYNMTYSAGTPGENLDNIRTLTAAGYKPDRVFIGVDSFSYLEDGDIHLSQQIRAPYEYSVSHPVKFYSMYMSASLCFESISAMRKNTHPVTLNGDIFYGSGWSINYGTPGPAEGYTRPFLCANQTGDVAANMAATLDDIREMKEYCDNNGIELVVFTNPMYVLNQSISIEKYNYLEFLTELAKITEYYNFSTVCEITEDSVNFPDVSHYSAEIGDMMIKILQGDDSLVIDDAYFGTKINSDNVVELTETLSHQL